MSLIWRIVRYVLYFGIGCALLGCLALATAYWLISPRLPSVDTLKDVHLQVPLKVLSADDRLIATFGETKRTPVRIEDVPDRLKHAFLAAEDADFYSHSGIDVGGIARAVWLTITTGNKHVAGGSTITQQVARMFFLSSEVSYTRKLSEIFLAFRIENALSKDEILQLYLNKSFFGHRSYGIIAAAEFYYGKTLDQLTLPECAMLASIPKFPSTGNPLSRPQRALERRGYVLGRMRDNRFISDAELAEANKMPDNAEEHEAPVEVDAPYFAELIRQEAIERLGNNALTDGFVVKTTLNSVDQAAATRALRDGLEQYDRRHGYRGAEGHADLDSSAGRDEWIAALAKYRPLAALIPALVTASNKDHAELFLADGQTVTLNVEALAWARRHASAKSGGVLKRGDIVRITLDADRKWMLTQIPAAESALVAINPEDGAVQSMVGGFSFLRSKFNRATQSARQPGSGFKPFLYSAAFEHGFTPASVLNDAPVSFPDPSKPGGVWSPKNDDDTFQGPVRLREALVKSINLVSVRLLDAIGVRYAREYATRFGLALDQIPPNLSMALGTAAIAPLGMARGFAVFANGGYLVDPYYIVEIDDRDGGVVYRANPVIACATCTDQPVTAPTQTPPASEAQASTSPLSPIGSAGASANPAPGNPDQPHYAQRTIDPRNAYLLTSMMRDVVKRGTGSAAMVLKRNDLAGKTGSTNDHRDAWFTGFNSKLVVSCWVGFDDFSSLGHGEFGAKAALPIWIDYMRAVLKDVPEQPFDMPSGITKVRVDRSSGMLAAAGDGNAILEVMKVEDATRLANQPPQADDQNSEQREAYDVF